MILWQAAVDMNFILWTISQVNYCVWEGTGLTCPEKKSNLFTHSKDSHYVPTKIWVIHSEQDFDSIPSLWQFL